MNSNDAQSWTMMRREDVDTKMLNLVNAVLDIVPDMPESVQEIMSMVYDPRTSSKEIANIAADDPVLVSSILTKVNTAYYALEQKISDINLAVVVLGFNEVRDLAIQCGLASRFDLEVDEEFNAKKAWGHMYASSICIEHFAENKRNIHTGLLMSIGMLHDIGKFALQTVDLHLKRLGVQSGDLSGLERGASHLEREECLYGINHAVVGGMLTEKWNLNENIHTVIEHHHDPSFFPITEIPEKYRKDIALVSIADFITNTLLESPTIAPQPDPSYFELLRLPSETSKLITPELRQKFKRVNEFIRDIL